MPPTQNKIFFPLFCCAVFLLSSCSDARRYFEGKPDTRAKSSTLKEPSFSELFASPSPTASVIASAKPTPNLAAFRGDIAGKTGKEKLYNFLEKNDQKTVKIDLLLSDEQLEQINDIDQGKKWYFDLAYEDKDGFNTGGELLIDIAKGKNGLHLDGNHLQGNIKIIGWSGPHQGLMSISAKPVGNEAASAKKVETKDAPAPRDESKSAKK